MNQHYMLDCWVNNHVVSCNAVVSMVQFCNCQWTCDSKLFKGLVQMCRAKSKPQPSYSFLNRLCLTNGQICKCLYLFGKNKYCIAQKLSRGKTFRESVEKKFRGENSHGLLEIFSQIASIPQNSQKFLPQIKARHLFRILWCKQKCIV